MAAMEENEDEGVSTLAEYMERVEEQELVRSLNPSPLPRISFVD